MVYVMVGMGGADGLMGALAEIEGGSDRSMAVVGASFVETALTHALKTHLHHNAKIADKLFDPSGAVGTFAAKIQLGRLVGLYGDKAFSDLDYMRKIRNDFAHKPEVGSFEHDRIRDWCRNLVLAERYTAQIQQIPDPRPDRPEIRVPMDREYWIARPDRDELIRTARGRYMLTIQVLLYGLSLARQAMMPAPAF